MDFSNWIGYEANLGTTLRTLYTSDWRAARTARQVSRQTFSGEAQPDVLLVENQYLI